MTNEYEILQSEWDYRIVQDQSGNKKKLIRGVDYDCTWINLGEGFAKRGKEIIFYNEKKFSKLYKIIDFETFELIQSYKTSTHYFKDKNHVYIDSYRDKDLTILEDANPNDFIICDIHKGFVTSKNTDYWYGVKIPFRLADAVFYEGGSYQKVGNQIYFAFANLVDCDVPSFEIVDKREHHKTVFKDKNHIYHKGKVVENANPATFHFLENCINDTLRPYYYNSDIHYYAKDDKYAYFINSVNSIKTIKTKDVDGFDFKVVDSRGIAFDKNYEYHQGVKKRI
ncbi:hypothetical protein GV828_02575 [Flavobacterium sp. NST-5]|uniref:DKNYY family protein n=1 Tax=Flavobacterium ichthyis TaxID=2698827 RepID=A0ABW9Z5G9_9FLAO|nr:DKNYY domain-containing protein [Flavobacterium ichthyis]NBL64082.1 hypothetical protein [Flavobacterium ichthyis]